MSISSGRLEESSDARGSARDDRAYDGGSKRGSHDGGSRRHESHRSHHRDRGSERGSERGYERGYERDRHVEHGRGRDSYYERGRDRDYERGRDRGYERGRDRGYERERPRDRDRERDREREYRSRREYPEHNYRESRRDRDRAEDRYHPDNRRSREDERLLSERHVENSGWDVPPPGCEGQSAAAVKMSGQFAAPGALARLRTGSDGSPAVNALDASVTVPGMTPQALRLARRVYIGNVPDGTAPEDLERFLCEKMHEFGLVSEPGAPVASCPMGTSGEGGRLFCFAVMRSFDEATRLLALDGLVFRGAALRLKRPRDFVPIPGFAVDVPRVAAGVAVRDSPNRLFVGGLSASVPEADVRQALESVGPLLGFNYVRDAATGQPKGFAFCEYADSAHTDDAIAKLHGTELGDRTISVERAHGAAIAEAGAADPLPAYLAMDAFKKSENLNPSTVLLLLNMVTEDELRVDEDYEDIVDDVKVECAKFGRIRSLAVPRPIPGRQVPGVGKIFVQFYAQSECAAALSALSGRKFADRTVVAGYYPEERYSTGEYD